MNYDLYAGFYQGLAWAQGAMDGPIRANVPDYLNSHTDETPFDLKEFMEVVADLDDEGGIHLWEIDMAGPTLVLWCTEDATPKTIPDTALHASGWVALALA